MAGDSCRLTLRVHGYERPDETSGFDANWLNGEVELVAGMTGAFRATHRVDFLAGEFERFRDELRGVVESRNGSASFTTIESQVGCTIELTNGWGSFTAFVAEHVGSNLQVDDASTDPSYLAQTLHALDALVEAFPVRGEGGGGARRGRGESAD